MAKTLDDQYAEAERIRSLVNDNYYATLAGPLELVTQFRFWNDCSDLTNKALLAGDITEAMYENLNAFIENSSKRIEAARVRRNG